MTSLRGELERIASTFSTGLQLHMGGFLGRVAEDLQQQPVEEPKAPEFAPEDMQELKRITEWFQKEDKEQQPPEIRSDKVAEFLASFYVSRILPKVHLKILAEMSLVWIVAFQEAFTKEYLRALLIRRPEIIKSSRQLSYEVILSHGSMEDLLNHVVDREVDELGYKDIDEVADYFQERLGIDLRASFGGWEAVREATYRRNVVIHNRGIANAIYCQKTGCGTPGDRVSPDVEYCNGTVESVLAFMQAVHQEVAEKFAGENV